MGYYVEFRRESPEKPERKPVDSIAAGKRLLRERYGPDIIFTSYGQACPDATLTETWGYVGHRKNNSGGSAHRADKDRVDIVCSRGQKSRWKAAAEAAGAKSLRDWVKAMLDHAAGSA